MATKAEKKLFDRTARLGCILCYHFGYDTKDVGVELHHIRRHGAVRKDCDVLPLCLEHHRGRTGVHGLGTKAFEKYHKIEYDSLLDIVKAKLNE
jgi:hypothetical protein